MCGVISPEVSFFLSEKTWSIGGSDRTNSLVCSGTRNDQRRYPGMTGVFAAHLGLVRRVDKQDEPPRHVLLVQIQLGHVRQKHRLKLLRDLEVVRRAQRLATQLHKAEFGRLPRRARDDEGPAPDAEVAVLDDLLAGRRGEAFEQLVDLGPVFGRGGVEVDLGEGAGALAVVCGSREGG